MKFWRNDTHHIFGHRAIDMNDRDSEETAVELDLPRGFSDKAKACWQDLEDSAFIFEYRNRLVITDEGFYLTAHGDGKNTPFGCPRFVVDSWDELERILEEIYDDTMGDE